MALIRIGIAIIGGLTISACGALTNTGLYDTSSAEVAGGAIASAAAASDSNNGTTVAYELPRSEKRTSPLSLLAQNLMTPSLATSCPLLTACSSNTLALGGCTGAAGTWTGSFGLAFVGGSSCGQALSSYTNGEGFTLTSTAGVTLTVGNWTLTDTSGNSGFANPLSGGTTVSCTSSGCSSRTVAVNGWHRVLAYNGLSLFDHTLNTSSPFAISQSAGVKTISSGTLVLQHNLARFVATSVISQPIVISGTCCVPISGSLTTTFSNGKTGTETVSFGPTCGSGTVNGNSFTLSYCQ